MFFSYNRRMLNLIKSLFAPAATKTTAGVLAEKFGLELRGDANAPVRGVAPIADARPGQLAFYSTERNSAAFKILPIDVLKNTRATVILVQPEQAEFAPAGATLLVTPSPRGNIVKILGEIYREKPRFGISRDAVIERGVFSAIGAVPMSDNLPRLNAVLLSRPMLKYTPTHILAAM